MLIRRWPLIALAVIAIVLVAGRAVASIHADHLWYEAMGAGDVWRTRALYGTLAGVLSSVVAGVVIFLNLYAVRRSIVSLVLSRRVANLEIGEEVPGRYLTAGVIGLAVLFGIILDLPANTWMSVALALGGAPFRETDPYFIADLGFFVYWLPLESALYLWSLITVLVATALVIFFYALTPSLKWGRGTLHVSGYVRRHLAVLAGLLLLVLAWSYRLDAFQLLIDGSGTDGEFLSADRRIGMRVATILAFMTVGAAIVVLWGGWMGQLPLVFGAVSIVLVLSFVLRQIVPALDIGADPRADPVARERPYLATRRGFTIRAFGVDRILAVDRSVGFRTWTEAAQGTPTWDLPVLGRALGWPHGRATVEMMPSLRMTPSGLIATAVMPPPDTSGAQGTEPWIVASARATRVDARGAPLRVDHLGFSAADDEALPGVLVHPGATGYRLVSDSLGIVPAPGLRGLGSRLAHAWSLQNFRLLRAPPTTPRRPVIVTRRDVRARVSALAPFFAQGSAITPVFAADSLYWIIELYSSAATYPLSAAVHIAGDTRKYFHHAATAIVAAASGDVQIVRVAEPDPIATSWFTRFPGSFVGIGEISRELAVLLPPVEDGALAQATVFARYGRRRESPPGGLLALQTGDSTSNDPAPLRLVLPISSPAPTWVQPVLDTAAHVRGVILATGGLTRASLWLPVPPSPARWSQMIDQLRHATDSSSPPRDGRWERGAMRAVPVAGELAYVQTTYVSRPANPPSVGSVSVLQGDSISTGPTVAHAVGVAIEPDEGAPVSARDFPARVQSLYAAMRAALQRGDWSAFGEAFEALGALLRAPRPLAPPPVPR